MVECLVAWNVVWQSGYMAKNSRLHQGMVNARFVESERR